MLLLAATVSDAVIIAGIAAVMPTVTVIVTSMMARADRRQQALDQLVVANAVTKHTSEAATLVSEKLADNAATVKLALDATTVAASKERASQSAKLDEIHTLVDGATTKLLRTVARLERRWADEHPEDTHAQLRAVAAETDLANDERAARGAEEHRESERRAADAASSSSSSRRPPGTTSRSTDPHLPPGAGGGVRVRRTDPHDPPGTPTALAAEHAEIAARATEMLRHPRYRTPPTTAPTPPDPAPSPEPDEPEHHGS